METLERTLGSWRMGRMPVDRARECHKPTSGMQRIERSRSLAIPHAECEHT